MAHSLSAKEQALSKVFSDDYAFTIPGYQRPYAWGEEQAQELLDDLVGAMREAQPALGGSVPYFLGSVVLIKKDSLPNSTVVDGQQRLTTITLLLSAIRSLVNDIGVQNGITKRIYEAGDVVSATEPSYRLLLRERDRDFFREYVQHENGLARLAELNRPLPDAQRRLRANALLFIRELAKLQSLELTHLVQYIITRCFLVVVTTPDLDSAYRIFGVLNSRGLDLSATDILKAEIIGALPESIRDAYTRSWEDKEEELGRSRFSELFGHIRMIYRKTKPKGTLLKEFRTHVSEISKPQIFMDKILLPMAEAFVAISDADYSSNYSAEKINSRLGWLNRLEFKDWMPPALAFYVRQKDDPVAMLAFYSDLERLAYSMLVRKIGVNERIERFSKLTDAIEKHEDLACSSSVLQLSPLEQGDMYAALGGPLYESHSPKALALLLLRLDTLVSDGSASYQYDVISVEHIMPQQPAAASLWRKWVGDTETHRNWVHRLGNLTLLNKRKNSAARNFELERKQRVYFTKGGTSPFALTTQVLSHREWTVAVMERRQAELLSQLVIHWRLKDRLSRSEKAVELLSAQRHASAEARFELRRPKAGIVANAREIDGVFVILAGSQARAKWVGIPHNYAELHARLIEEGSLIYSSDDNTLNFANDVDFKSPSAASAVVLGRADNGRTSWLLQGTTIDYGTWQASQGQNTEL